MIGIRDDRRDEVRHGRPPCGRKIVVLTEVFVALARAHRQQQPRRGIARLEPHRAELIDVAFGQPKFSLTKLSRTGSRS